MKESLGRSLSLVPTPHPLTRRNGLVNQASMFLNCNGWAMLVVSLPFVYLMFLHMTSSF